MTAKSNNLKNTIHKAARVGAAAYKVFKKAQNQKNARAITIREPLQLVDGQHTGETLYNKKTRISKSQIKKRKFALKVEKALQAKTPINTWVEYGNSFSSSGRQVLVTPVGYSTNDANSFQIDSRSNWLLHPGYAWFNSGATNTYPNGPLDRLKNDILFPSNSSASEINASIRTTHARMDCKIKNTSTTGLWYSVYTFVAAQDIEDLDFRDVGTACASLSTAPIGKNYLNASYANKANMAIAGHSPLDFPGLGLYWKQETKTKIFIPTGGLVEFNFPKCRTPSFAFENMHSWAMKGKTQCLFIQIEGFTSEITGIGSGISIVEVDKTYHYKVASKAKPDEMNNPLTTRLQL